MGRLAASLAQPDLQRADPAGGGAAGTAGLDEWFHKPVPANQEERILALFVFLFTALIVLTVIGIFFRGAGMALYLAVG